MKIFFLMKDLMMSCFFCFFRVGYFVSNNLRRLFLSESNQTPPPPPNPCVGESVKIKEYEKKMIQKFLKTYEPGFSKNMNENINQIFYSKKEFEEKMKDMDNIIEREWKTKILFENTPRGKVIMFYDAYKMGFSYYSDNSFISYSILNSVAMKYVMTFFCRDFFVDENTVELKSPFINLYFKEEKKKETKKEEIKGPFAKLKNYKMMVKNDIPPNTMDKEKPDTKTMNKIVNKFIYMGKITNFNPINKKIIQKNFSTNYDDLFSNIYKIENRLISPNMEDMENTEEKKTEKEGENDGIINKSKMSYKKFKKFVNQV